MTAVFVLSIKIKINQWFAWYKCTYNYIPRKSHIWPKTFMHLSYFTVIIIVVFSKSYYFNAKKDLLNVLLWKYQFWTSWSLIFCSSIFIGRRLPNERHDVKLHRSTQIQLMSVKSTLSLRSALNRKKYSTGRMIIRHCFVISVAR